MLQAGARAALVDMGLQKEVNFTILMTKSEFIQCFVSLKSIHKSLQEGAPRRTANYNDSWGLNAH